MNSKPKSKSKSKSKWAFIINPAAGGGHAAEYENLVRQNIEKYQVNAEIHFTKAKGHASELASQLSNQDYTHLIAVGGDGTLNEIINGLPQKNSMTLGIVTAGTGNDLAVVLGFDSPFSEEEWHQLFQENVVDMDVGVCNDHLFLNGMGLGFDAQVAAENYDKEMNIKSDAGEKYLWHIVKNLLGYKEKMFRADIDGQQIEALTFMNTIANGRRFAGDYFITPKAIANDGLLDICHVEPLKLFERFKIFLKVPKGKHLDMNKVNYYQTAKVSVDFEEVVPYHLDGELFFDQNFEVSILPGNQKIIYNPEGAHFFKL